MTTPGPIDPAPKQTMHCGCRVSLTRCRLSQGCGTGYGLLPSPRETLHHNLTTSSSSGSAFQGRNAAAGTVPSGSWIPGVPSASGYQLEPGATEHPSAATRLGQQKYTTHNQGLRLSPYLTGGFKRNSRKHASICLFSMVKLHFLYLSHL